MQTLGDVYADIRKRRGWALPQMGEALGVKKAHVSHLEKNRRNASLRVFGRYLRLAGRINRHFLIGLLEIAAGQEASDGD